MAQTGAADRKPVIAAAGDRWMRLLYMVIFAIIGYALLWLILFLAAVQFALAWIGGAPNETLRDFAAKLDAYMRELVDFIGYVSDVVPYPVSPLGAAVAQGAATKPAPRRRRRTKPAPAAPEPQATPPAGESADDL